MRKAAWAHERDVENNTLDVFMRTLRNEVDPPGRSKLIHIRRVKKRSIGVRLAAWYFVVFACGLAAFSVAASLAMRASIYHAVDDELRDRVHGMSFAGTPSWGPGGDLFQVCDKVGLGK